MKHIELGNTAILTCKDISAIPPEYLAGVSGMLLDSVGPVHHAVRVPFHDSQARGKAILIRTGWDEIKTGEPGPYLHDELVFRLIRAKVRLVGVDFSGVDCSQLIANDISIVQGLENLKALPNTGFRIFVEPSERTGTTSTAAVSAAVHRD